ncbi:unnamed protein product [Musa acuminata var. zebrina]
MREKGRATAKAWSTVTTTLRHGMAGRLGRQQEE